MAETSESGARYPTAETAEQFAENYRLVEDRIQAAARRAGRDPGEVRLMPVSKTVPQERMREAIAAGMTLFGENKVQEARRKSEELSDVPGLRWAVIGHLQTNKAKYVARFAQEFQALDSNRVAEALQRRLEIEDRRLDVFVQVNTSEEESKFGLDPDDAPNFVSALSPFDRLNVRGLMTLAVFSADRERVRRCFVQLRGLQEHIRQETSGQFSVDELSMGMSGDYEVAVEEGATTVRVGQAIFGARALPDSYYWPSGGGGA